MDSCITAAVHALREGIARRSRASPCGTTRRHLYCVGADGHEAKMSPDSSNTRRIWPWGKPLPRFQSPEEEQTFWATYEVEGPPQDVGEVVVSDQSRWMRRARPVFSAGWAGLGGFIGAVVGSFFGAAGAAIGGGVGAAMAAYVLAARSRQEQRSP